MSRTNKTLEDYQRIIAGGYALSLSEIRHFDSLWEEKLRKAKKEIDKGAIETMLDVLKRRVAIDVGEIIKMLGDIP